MLDMLPMPVKLENYWGFQCLDKDGNIKWEDGFPNLVVDEGLNDLLDKYFKGSSYSASHWVGLIDNANFTELAPGDTAAKINTAANPPTTNGWQEADDYSGGGRKALILGDVSGQSVDNSASKASFSITSTVTLKGAFVTSNGTIGGTDGVLYGAGAFTGARDAVNGDTLNVTVTLTSAAA